VESVPAVPRTPPKTQPREVPTLSEGSTEVRQLGYIVSSVGIITDTEEFEAIWKWPTPKNKHKIRSFLGLCTYYRRFISGFVDIAKLLTKLMEEKQAFQWTPEVESIFQTLKEALCIAPILAYPQPSERFVVDTCE
jgi:hypothetical protein